MKKFLSLLLAAMMLLSCLPAMAEDALVWKINASLGTLKLDSSSKAVGHVEIPAEVDGVPVLALDYMCFKSCFDIIELTIPDTVRMFECSTLDGAANLAALSLPRDLLIIKNGSLTNMPLLETLTVPASVSVVNGAFSNLPKMKSITFEGVCPVFVKDSYYGMFADLPADCVIYVPDDQIDAYKAAFADREDVLARIQPSGKNAVVIDWTAPESDFQFDASTGTITGYTGTASRLEIPATIGGVDVKHIGKQAFLQKYSLMYVTIPEGVETIDKQAFHGCSLMTYVSFPTTLHTIGDSAFNTNNLVDIGWSEGLESIGSKAFYNCDICYATLPTTLRTVADSGFENAGFVEVTFGPNVETVGEKGFAAKTIEAITFTGKTMPAFGADAFKGCKKDATLTLADGCPKELYDSFVTYMADAFPTCVVNEPAAMELPFPTLDVMAGMPFFGDWHSVAGKDVMGEFTDEYPVVNATLNPDGTAAVNVDGVDMPSAWYVEAGYAFLAPVENGKADAASTYAMANIDENGRLVIDFFYASAICEQEGKVYAVPAVPEKPWPELNLEDGKYYVGAWQTADGSMILTLNDDGTATSVEAGEEPYELRWYAEYPSAFVGETVNTAYEINFDGNGNIELSMDGQKIILAPYVEPTVIEGADELLGEWLDDIGNKLVLTNDGVMTYTYASDGWVNEYKWDMVDGAAVVTEGNWVGCPITLENGILIISGDNAFQLFSVDGDLSAYYGDDDELPEAQPIGPEGEPYFGVWKLESMMGMNAADMGMTMDLYLNEDGTCSIFDGYEHDYNVWAVENGAAMVDGSPLTINAEGKLVMSQEGMDMIFVKGEGAAIAVIEPADEPEEEPEEEDDEELPEAQPIGEEGAAYFGAWQTDMYGMTMILTLNQDGTCAMDMMGEVEAGIWTMADGKAYVMGDELTFDGDGNLVMASAGMVFTKAEDGASTEEMTEEEQLLALLAMMNQMDNEGSQDGDDEDPLAPTEPAQSGDPYIGRKFLMTGTMINGIQLTAAQLGAEGDYIIFNADGSAELFMGGRMIDNRGWKRGTVTVVGAEYEGFCVDYYGTMYNFGIVEDGLLLDYFGTPRLYEAESAPAPAEPAAPTESEAPVSLHLDRTFKLTTASTVYAGQLFPVDVAAYGEYNVRLGSDGSVKFVQSGLELPADCLSWATNADGAYVVSYGVGGVVMMEYTFKPVGNALEMDYYGVTMTFTPAE